MKKNFTSLNIKEEFTDILERNRITEPTPVQAQSIPVLMAGRDLIAQAQTGTGKTLAFLLPMMDKIDMNDRFVQALVIAPTRELALQITDEAKKLASVKNVNILAAYGGQDVNRQIHKLKGNVQIVIGTPGRLLDHINRGTVSFGKIKMLVLDEADQMLDMGFIRDVEKIIDTTPKNRQTLLCSATMPKAIQALSTKHLRNPHHIAIAGKSLSVDEIKHLAVEISDDKRQEAICSLIDEMDPYMSIIFCRTKRRAHSLNRVLRERGLNSDEIHGDITQGKRERVMQTFRDTRIQFLVATDVAARGLDIDGVTHVFNYDIPRDSESYIHRTGRTGRAGKEGFAITLVTPAERKDFMNIEKDIKLTIDRRTISKDIKENKDNKEIKDKTSEVKSLVPGSAAPARPYSVNSTPGRNDRGNRKFAGDSRSENPYGRSTRRKQGDSYSTEKPITLTSHSAKPDRSVKMVDKRRNYDGKSSYSQATAGAASKDSRPQRSDRPERSFNSDRPQSGARPERSFNSDRPQRSFGSSSAGADRPKRPAGSTRPFSADRPQRSERPERSFNSDRPQSGARPERSFNSDRPQRSFGSSSAGADRPKRPAGSTRPFSADRPQRSERPERSFNSDRPQRAFGTDTTSRTEKSKRPEGSSRPSAKTGYITSKKPERAPRKPKIEE